jgi:hypothetical protein
MLKGTIIATLATLFALCAVAAYSVRYLLPIATKSWAVYGDSLLIYTALLTVNLFVLYLRLGRWVMRTNMGQKAKHLKEQVKSGEISRDLDGLGEHLRAEDNATGY